MKSKYLYIAQKYRTNDGYGHDADLGLSIGSGAATGAAVGSVVPGAGTAVGAAVGTAAGLIKPAGNFVKSIGSIFGGGGGGPSKSEDRQEAGSVLKKTGDQLAAVIALTDKGSLGNSQQAASKVRQAIQNGNPSLLDLQNIIDLTLGYGRNSTPEPDSNWPWQKINPLLRQMLAAPQKSTSNSNPVAAAVGGGNMTKYVLIGGGVLAAISVVAIATKPKGN
jgi:hypothetical protein